MTRYVIATILAFFLRNTLVAADNVTLPNQDTNDGLLARLFIAESRTPAYAGYDAENVKKGMRAMKATVDNRLRHHPALFGAPNATTYLDIVSAAGQFNGFSKTAAGRLQISSDVQQRFNAVLLKANTGKPGRYAQFVNNAIAAARDPIDDPFKDVKKIGNVDVTGGTYGWRREGSSTAGGKLIAIPASQGGIISGNQFYSVKK